jgi:hypothetical protein
MRAWWLIGLAVGCAGGEGPSGDDDDGFGGDAENCPATDPAVDVVSADEAQVEDMVGDATHLYWADGLDYGVHRVEKATGVAEVLYVPRGIATVLDVALDDDFVYFHETSLGPPHRVMRIPKAGGDAEKLSDLDAIPWALAVDDAAVYSAVGPAFGGQELVAVAKGGGAPTVLGDIGGSTFGLAVADGRVWWTAIDDAFAVNLRSVPVTGGPVEVLGSTSCQSRLQVDGGDLWCVSLDTVERLDRASGEATVVLSGPYGGTRGFEDAAGADGWVYAVGGVTAEGEVRRARRDGSDEELVSCAQNFPRAVVVDGTAIWVGNSGGPSVANATGGIRRIDLP